MLQVPDGACRFPLAVATPLKPEQLIATFADVPVGKPEI
jgi:hypothetical protein